MNLCHIRPQIIYLHLEQYPFILSWDIHYLRRWLKPQPINIATKPNNQIRSDRTIKNKRSVKLPMHLPSLYLLLFLSFSNCGTNIVELLPEAADQRPLSDITISLYCVRQSTVGVQRREPIHILTMIYPPSLHKRRRTVQEQC